MNEQSFNDYDIVSSGNKRSGAEERWVSFQPHLLSKGYLLRPRYHPDWIPSWKTTGLRAEYCEDSIDCMVWYTDHQIRQVMIKMLIPRQGEGENELPILQLFSSASLKDDPANHVVPCLETFPIPGDEPGHFIVMPLLGQYDEIRFERIQEIHDLLKQLFEAKNAASPTLLHDLLKGDPANHVVPCLDTFPIPGDELDHFIVMPLLGQYDEIPFKRIPEIHDLLKQLFEGLIFMHKHDVTHCSANIMMDSRILYDEPFHPVDHNLSLDVQRMVYPRYSRLEKHIRYYFIDMGYATWFRNPSEPRLVTGKSARIMAPEQKQNTPYDPFLVDIYQLGMVIKQDIIPLNNALDFLKPLAEKMTLSDPSTRPTLIRAQESMNTAFLGLNGVKYRWPLVPREAGFRARAVYFASGKGALFGKGVGRGMSYTSAQMPDERCANSIANIRCVLVRNTQSNSAR
ncbi:Pkinase domain-containing protein [Rhizoctonia solani AG-1 IA]|uniref:Pkinase domain-containing protein n=1 Tax=Thanatephorus cucumeris (strain AG1-IA) TaxID=983506 RepID=L8WIB8_THACA|nr:Pkinase domain-containing protein [Rhizoctonia solani AG-1 IA]